MQQGTAGEQRRETLARRPLQLRRITTGCHEYQLSHSDSRGHWRRRMCMQVTHSRQHMKYHDDSAQL